MVFVGDFCDRGPDSPAVLALVQQLLEAGRAVAVPGNHEVNLLRDDVKDGSGWFFDARMDKDNLKYAPYRRPTLADRIQIVKFSSSLPIGLERKGLTPYYADGKWRFVERVQWWDEYEGVTPVVIGHYWRRVHKIDTAVVVKRNPDLFGAGLSARMESPWGRISSWLLCAGQNGFFSLTMVTPKLPRTLALKQKTDIAMASSRPRQKGPEMLRNTYQICTFEIEKISVSSILNVLLTEQ